MARRIYGYTPAVPFNCTMKILRPITTMVKGVRKDTYSDPDAISKEDTINCSFRTFGGKEVISNGVLTTLDTATIDTWYRPDITSDCRLYDCESGASYEIMGAPEDIDRRHQYLQIKVKKVGGKP